MKGAICLFSISLLFFSLSLQLLYADTRIEVEYNVGSSPYNCDAPYAMCFDGTNIWLIDSYDTTNDIRLFRMDPSSGALLDEWSLPGLEDATGVAYETSTNDLIVLIGGITSYNEFIRVDLDNNPPTVSTLSANIPFNYPIDLCWDNSSETHLWVSKNDTVGVRYVRRVQVNPFSWDASGFDVGNSKYPSGMMCDDTYIYSQGNNNGIIYRFNRSTGLQDDLNGLFPMLSPYDVSVGNYAANMWFDTVHGYTEGDFWMLSWYNKKIYRIHYWPHNDSIQSKSIGWIKALMQ